MKTKIKKIPNIDVVSIGDEIEGDSGVECTFYKPSRKARKGYKIYSSLTEARQTRKRQLKAYRLGLGPKPGNLIVAVDSYEEMLGYGYITQVAHKATVAFYRPRIRWLEKKIEEAGFASDDLHRANTGRIGNKLVCVDFGAVSMESD